MRHRGRSSSSDQRAASTGGAVVAAGIPPTVRPGRSSGCYQPLWLLPALSGAEVVAALEQAGFSRTDSPSDRVELSNRRGDMVEVPRVPVLDSDQIGSVLAAARLSVVALLGLLERTSQ